MEHNLDLYNPYGSYEIAKEALEEPGLVQTEAPSLRAYKTPCKSTSTTTINICTYTF